MCLTVDRESGTVEFSREGPPPDSAGTSFQQAGVRCTSDIVLLTNESGIILAANDAAVAAYGREGRQLVGLDVRELYAHGAPREAAEARHESVHVRGDLSLFPVEITSTQIEVGGRIFSQRIVRDISARKQAEAALQAAEAMFRGIAESVPAMIWTVDAGGNCTYLNQRFTEFTGVSSREASGKSWPSVINPENAAQYEAAFRAALAQRLPYELMLRMKNTAGMLRWFLDRASPRFSADGVFQGLVGAAVDITDHRENSDRLQWLSPAVEQSPASVVITDVDGNIEYVNPRFTQVTGYSAEEVLGRNPRILKSGEMPAESYRKMWQTISSGADWRGEFHNRKKSGELYWEAASLSPIKSPEGAITHYLAVKEDITDRKEAEERIAQTNRQLRQLSTDLLRSQDYERRRIARELHDSTAQLLAGISMDLSRLRDQKLTPSRRRELLSGAMDLVGQCSREIRTLSYLLHPPLLDEMGLVSALQSYAEGFRERSGIELEVSIPPDFGRLSADAEMTLFRIIQEGLANIHRHSGSRLAAILLQRDTREARLELRDWGRGLPKALSPGKKAQVRLGVGILGMRERAEQLGGRLEISSTDVGTAIHVILPITESNAENTSAGG